jgi:two-component system, NtrC family, response regulator GlrR
MAREKELAANSQETLARVIVYSSEPRAEVAQALAASLMREGIQAQCGLFGKTTASELAIQVAAEEDLPLALRQLVALRALAPECRVLVASLALCPAGLGRLLDGGAGDFLSVPPDPREVVVRVRRMLHLSCAGAPDHCTADPASAHPALRALVGNSPVFMQQVARLPVFARYDASVMILGDTGTGKELCARAIHYLSPRAENPWVPVNCAAIPAELLEAELFGHVKGAYTGAHAARPGLVREAQGGTLFLDEIDSLPRAAQGKLLRFLQDKESRAVGADTVQHADVRIIAASNRPLAQLRADAAFRQDLLYRLNVLTLQLPALRERRADIAQLTMHLVRAAAAQWQRPAPLLSAAALQKLIAHDWPGNVRELKNVVERAVLMCAGDTLTATDIDIDGTAAIPEGDAHEDSFREAKARMVEHFERAFIQQLLASNGGNVTRAAQAAKKNRRAFFELMRKYRIEPATFRDAR